MLYLYGDESNTPGEDKVWAVGFLFSAHIRKLTYFTGNKKPP